MAKCIECERGPAHIEGHQFLFTVSMGGSRMLFRCSTCGTTWSRRYAGDGGFEWAAPAGEHPGVDTPGRREISRRD
jgi:hypothetical protein